MEEGDVNTLEFRYKKAYPKTDSKEVATLISEYRKFMSLKIEQQDFKAEKLSPSPKIDQVWHLHILDTQSYASSCGDNFIHHDPSGADDDQFIQQAKRYARTYELLDKTSRQHVKIWPKPLKVLGCEYINTERSLCFQLNVYSDGHHDDEILEVFRKLDDARNRDVVISKNKLCSDEENAKDFTIRVRLPNGVIYPVTVDRDCIVWTLKCHLTQLVDANVERLQIVFQSKVLNDNVKLHSLVTEKDLFYVILNERGC